MISLVIRATSLYVVSLFFWVLARRVLRKLPIDNVAGPPAQSWICGNLNQFFNRRGWPFHASILEKYGKVVKIHALFGDKQLYVADPLALYHILLKDHDAYDETQIFFTTNRLAFGYGLIGTTGEHHRKQRKMLTPVFSASHMRNMVPTFYQISHKLRDVLVTRVSNGPAQVDMLEWMSRTALELIGQSGLGYSFDSFENETPSPFTQAVKPTISNIFLAILLLPWVVKIGSPSFRRALVEIMPWERGQKFREIIDVIAENSSKVFKEKKVAVERGEEAALLQIGEGKDIMSILLRANLDAQEEDRLSDSELLGQISTLLFAAMDTTSSALARVLHLLSEHPEVQEKLRTEIAEARLANGDLGYDELVVLPYLDAVCRETLRLHAPVPWISRTTQKDTVLPLSQPLRGVNGKEIDSIPLSKNTDVILGILAVNRDRSIWGDDASEWKPERWLSPLPESVRNAQIPGIYSNTMTFLGGGRSCIGFKFSQLEMKVVLSVLVESFSFAPAAEIEWGAVIGIQTPSIKGLSELKATLPLSVSLAPAVGSF